MIDAGELPQNWTIANLLGKHPSKPYNPLLANAFFRAGYIESWGRGIEKIKRECMEHDIDVPKYDLSMSGMMLTFHANPIHLSEVLNEKVLNINDYTETKLGVNAEEGLGVNAEEGLGETKIMIMENIIENPKITFSAGKRRLIPSSPRDSNQHHYRKNENGDAGFA